MQNNFSSLQWVNNEFPPETQDKLLHLVEHLKKFGSVSELSLCKIFGETVWNDGTTYHSHAVSFKINKDAGTFQISPSHFH